MTVSAIDRIDHSFSTTPIRDCKRAIVDVDSGDGRPYQREVWFFGTVVVWDHPVHEGHMATACGLLGLQTAGEVFSRSAPGWITVGVLTSLRQSIREAYANGWSFSPEDFRTGPAPRLSRAAFTRWMRTARSLDFAHHGAATF